MLHTQHKGRLGRALRLVRSLSVVVGIIQIAAPQLHGGQVVHDHSIVRLLAVRLQEGLIGSVFADGTHIGFAEVVVAAVVIRVGYGVGLEQFGAGAGVFGARSSEEPLFLAEGALHLVGGDVATAEVSHHGVELRFGAGHLRGLHADGRAAQRREDLLYAVRTTYEGHHTALFFVFVIASRHDLNDLALGVFAEGHLVEVRLEAVPVFAGGRDHEERRVEVLGVALSLQLLGQPLLHFA